MVQPLWKTDRQFLREKYFYILLPYNPVIVLLGIYTNGLLCSHKNLDTDLYSGFIHNCQNLEAAKMSFSRWLDK